MEYMKSKIHIKKRREREKGTREKCYETLIRGCEKMKGRWGSQIRLGGYREIKERDRKDSWKPSWTKSS